LVESSEQRIIVAGVIKIQAGGRIEALTGELLRHIGGALMTTEGAIGAVLRQFDHRPGGIGDDVRGAEVIRVVEAQGSRGILRGQALAAGEGVLSKNDQATITSACRNARPDPVFRHKVDKVDAWARNFL